MTQTITNIGVGGATLYGADNPHIFSKILAPSFDLESMPKIREQTNAGNAEAASAKYKERLGSGMNGSYGGKTHSAMNSDNASPRQSPRPGMSGADKSDKEHYFDHMRTDVIGLKKKVDFIQTLHNKQSEYFDDHMHKMSIKLENIANLEKKLMLYIDKLDIVPQLQSNLLDIRDNQLPNLVEDLRKQMVSKIESAISKHTSASVKAETVE